MIITYLCGGLGNQMFQYAAARRLATHLGTELKLDLGEYRSGADHRPQGLTDFRRPLKLYELSVTEPAATEAELARFKDRFGTTSTRDRLVRRIRNYLERPQLLWPASHVKERGYRFESLILELPDNTYLQGYWQSWRYFADIEPEIRTRFQIKDPSIAAGARIQIDRLRQLGGPVVALHVRRGDLAHAVEKLKDSKKVYSGPLGLEYIRKAIGRFGSDARFLVFSDTQVDIDWCRQNITADGLSPDRLHFSEGNTDLHDMSAMSQCDHNIIANSTFSWWSAWLNQTPGRRVIAPGTWCTPGSAMDMPTDDLLPPDWERI
jgi:hypothetical protein